MQCRIDHSIPGSIPLSLCRLCNPGRGATAEQWLAAEAARKAEEELDRLIVRADMLRREELELLARKHRAGSKAAKRLDHIHHELSAIEQKIVANL